MSLFKVRCVTAGSNCAATGLTEGRVYMAVPDPKAAKFDEVRIIDDTGESHLYPWSYFAEIDADEEAAVSGARSDELSEQIQQHIDALRNHLYDVTDASGEAVHDVADIFADGIDRYPDLDNHPDVNYCYGWLVGLAFALRFAGGTPDMLAAGGFDTAVYEREDGEAIPRPEGVS